MAGQECSTYFGEGKRQAEECGCTKNTEVVLYTWTTLHHCMAGRSKDLFIGRAGMYENEADVRQADLLLYRQWFPVWHMKCCEERH